MASPSPESSLPDARPLWPLDPAVAYLNHGGYGVAPIEVLAAQRRWRDRIERNPTGFITRELAAALSDATRTVATTVGAAESDLVFVENATAGINAVLRSLALEPGDEILLLGLSYAAVTKAARFAAEKSGARLVQVPLPLPVRGDADILGALAARLGPRTRLAIFDHIASASALLLPAAAMIRLAHDAGARVLIDGAHAPGQVALDIPALGADWYVGNLHKWYFAPRACGFLWAAPAAQADLHPIAISHGLGDGLHAEFDWTGTRDFTPFFAAPDGIACHERLGGAALRSRNVTMARDAATLLTGAWRTETGGPEASFAAMTTVRLPIGGPVSPARAVALCRWLGEAHRIEVAITAEGNAFWLRFCAQAYNRIADYERLAEIFATPRDDMP